MTSTTSTPPALSLKSAITYVDAMKLFFLTEQGEVAQVESASETDFKAFIEHTLRTSQQPPQRLHACREELEDLEFDLLGRWFTLLTLQEHCIAFLVFLTLEDASASGCQQVLI